MTGFSAIQCLTNLGKSFLAKRKRKFIYTFYFQGLFKESQASIGSGIGSLWTGETPFYLLAVTLVLL